MKLRNKIDGRILEMTEYGAKMLAPDVWEKMQVEEQPAAPEEQLPEPEPGEQFPEPEELETEIETQEQEPEAEPEEIKLPEPEPGTNLPEPETEHQTIKNRKPTRSKVKA